MFKKGRSHGKIESILWPLCREDLQQRLSFASTFLPGFHGEENGLKKLKGKKVSRSNRKRKKNAKSNKVNTVLTFYLVEIKDAGRRIQWPKHHEI